MWKFYVKFWLRLCFPFKLLFSRILILLVTYQKKNKHVGTFKTQLGTAQNVKILIGFPTMSFFSDFCHYKKHLFTYFNLSSCFGFIYSLFMNIGKTIAAECFIILIGMVVGIC